MGRCIGGAGFDRLIGGEGADVYVFEAGGDRDVLVGFELGVDKIDVSAYEGLTAKEVLSQAKSAQAGGRQAGVWRRRQRNHSRRGAGGSLGGGLHRLIRRSEARRREIPGAACGAGFRNIRFLAAERWRHFSQRGKHSRYADLLVRAFSAKICAVLRLDNAAGQETRAFGVNGCSWQGLWS
ncbi:MAG: hypothetical protein KTR21_10205 [Rhodobacteraceae bacterium]|nr:hypothetical protein [Paracoccaceae bacterium]